MIEIFIVMAIIIWLNWHIVQHISTLKRGSLIIKAMATLGMTDSTLSILKAITEFLLEMKK